MPRQQVALPSFADEDTRVEARRRALATGLQPDAPVFALAVSGGGIRSATFALGVMQALNDVPAAASATPPQGAPASPRLSHLLARFDYLSTVSGGGYVGSFFCSLFVPGRLDASTSRDTKGPGASHEAARLAHEVMANDPPGRMRIEAEKEAEDDAEDDAAVLCRQPLAWLRENGRYLAPTGAGDLVYAIALAIRNWLAIQYVLATVVVAALSGLMLTRALMVEGFYRYGGATIDRLIGTSDALPSLIASGLIWGIGIAIVVLWSFPAGIAFWMVQPGKHQSDADVPRHTSPAALGDLAIGLVLTIALPQLLRTQAADHYLAFAGFFYAIGVQAMLGFGFYEASRRGLSVIEHRVMLTRELALSLQCAAFVFLFALADTLALDAYNWLVTHADAFQRPAALSALLAAAIWGVRHLSLLFDQKSGSSWWRKLPVDILAGVMAFAIALAVIVIWATLINWMVWNGDEALPVLLDRTSITVLVMIALVTFGMASIVGQFPAFINLSSLQSIYGARLTRAYLGASNGERLRARMRSEGIASVKGGSVAEPLPSDQITHHAYYAPDVLAPLHIINVTVNQTTDSNEQLVQRDRKGMPLAVLPTGFTIDGRYAPFENDVDAKAIERPLTIGQWIGTSGAAVATGLGRTTTRGLSLLMGLANVRLGTWWQSGQGPDTRMHEGTNSRGWVRRVAERLFATQSYLLSELTAQFHGLHRHWQYLSDGGHFDNTGIYELLRPERNVRFIVACDDGADVEGHFPDLANLVRLARIDFELELEINQEICSDPVLGHIFGRPEDLVPGAVSKKCAMLIDVFGAAASTRQRALRCRILVLKPRVIDGTPLDILQYAASHPTFPNESTAQQFFDEAQWESYRRLGVTIGRTAFGLKEDATAGHADTLWSYLEWSRVRTPSPRAGEKGRDPDAELSRT